MANDVSQVFGLWGLAGGATDDWYITQNIEYSYTFELPERDGEGDHGFLLPAKNIIKVSISYDEELGGHYNIFNYRLGDSWCRDLLPWQRSYDEQIRGKYWSWRLNKIHKRSSEPILYNELM